MQTIINHEIYEILFLFLWYPVSWYKFSQEPRLASLLWGSGENLCTGFQSIPTGNNFKHSHSLGEFCSPVPRTWDSCTNSQNRKHFWIGHMVPRPVSRTTLTTLSRILIFKKWTNQTATTKKTKTKNPTGFYRKILILLIHKTQTTRLNLEKKIQSSSLSLYFTAFQNFLSPCRPTIQDF